MSSCAECIAKIELYLDGELIEDEKPGFLSHLDTCSDCKKAFEEAKELSTLIRSTRPSISAPESLRQNVLRMMHEQPGLTNVEPFPQPKAVTGKAIIGKRTTWILVAAAAICCAIGSILALAHLRSRSGAEDMIRLALLAHQGIEQHTLPLDVTSDSPQTVSAWFSNRVPFQFRMANSGIAADSQAKYKLTGGRLMTVRGERAALLSFKLPDQIVSMLVASNRIASAMGGKTFDSDGVTFHSRNRGQFHIVSWNNQGLTYVMISRMSMGDTRNCLKCHDRASSETEKPVASMKLHRWLKSNSPLFLAQLSEQPAPEELDMPPFHSSTGLVPEN